MKNAQNKYQQKSKVIDNPAKAKVQEVEAPEVEILPAEEIESAVIENLAEVEEVVASEEEILPAEEIESAVIENLAEVEEVNATEEDILPAEEIESDETEQNDEPVPSEEEQSTDGVTDSIPEHMNGTGDKAKLVLKTANADISNKLKIRQLKRSLENKFFALDREKIKVRDWRVQATDMDKKATDEYTKRKAELEAMLEKNQTRFDKRMEKTKKFWWEYCVNHEQTKMKKMQDDISLLQLELEKIEALESPEVAK